MRILVTGGNGYLGTYFVKALSACGHEVYYTVRRQREMVSGNVRYLNLADDSSFTEVCRGMDVVIHTATMDERKIPSDGRAALEINAFGTRQLYLDAVKCGVKKFIYMSTFHVYGYSSGVIDESTIPMPKSDYGLTHYFAEQYLMQLSKNNSCKVDIIRLTNGVGVPLGNADKWYLAVNDFCRSAFENQKIVLQSDGTPLRDFVAIHDLAEAVRILAEENGREPFEIYNISSQQSISMKDAAEQVADLYTNKYGKHCGLVIPGTLEKKEHTVLPLTVLSGKIRKLGWENHEQLADTIEDIFLYLEQGKTK